MLAYLPLLLTHRGMVAADTKPYLTLDPGGLLAGASSMWQPNFAMGTVTHQNLGFLWPTGPFFAVGDLLGLSGWIVQRLWLGSILLAAGLGLRWFLRTIGWRGAPVLVASLAYMLSPYVLDYIARISVILLPWAGLPWMLALTVRALRTPGWRHPAMFALVTLTIGGVNATSLLLVGLGPVLWIAWSVAEGSVSRRQAVGVVSRIGLLLLGTSAWWIIGLRTQATYGLPTLRLTETYEVIADAATAPELFRGLGYWFFYGQDKLGAWIEPAYAYTRWALPLSFALPLCGLLAASVTRFRFRSHLLLLFGVGMLAAVAAHPFDSPSPLGRVFREWTTTDAGLAMRSTPRALPLVVLATAVFLGAGAEALGRRLPRFRQPIAAVLCLAILANFSPLWRGQLPGDNLQRPLGVPAYWASLAASLHAASAPRGTPVPWLPGGGLAPRRWGNTAAPHAPGTLERGGGARGGGARPRGRGGPPKEKKKRPGGGGGGRGPRPAPCRADGCPHHHRHLHRAAGHVAQHRRVAVDLVHRTEQKIAVLHVGDRPHPHDGRPDGGAEKAQLRDRRIQRALRELLLQTQCYGERTAPAAGHADVLSKAEHRLVSPHLFADPLAQGLGYRQTSHLLLSVLASRRRSEGRAEV